MKGLPTLSGPSRGLPGAARRGGAAAVLWTPADLPDLALWLDADDASTITLNGSNVSQWDDKSGNARHVSRATAANQPAYTASGLNGKPVITFDGTNDSLINASAGLMRAVSGATAVVVTSRAANLAAGSDLLWIGMSAGNARLVMSFRIGLAAPGQGFTSGGRRLSTDSFQTVTGFAYTSNPIIAAARHDYANASLEIWQDGTAGASRVYQTAGVTDNNAGELSVGAGNVAGTGAPLNGYIAEITLVHSALSTTDRQKLEGYLAWKWGLTYALPNDHPYKWNTLLFGGTNQNGFDADAKTYITAVETADGQDLEPGVRAAINNFVVGCKADGIWDAIKTSCILAGARTLTGALVPLKGTAPTNFNFVPGDYNRQTGLVGNGSTKYLDSNRNNNAAPQNNFHMTTYVTTASTVTCALIGARQGAGAEVGSSQVIHVVGPPATSSFRINSAAVENSVNGIGVGLAGVSRTGATALNWRHSSSFTGTGSPASETPFSINIHVFQRSGIGGNVPTNARLAFYSIGESLDLALLDTRVTALINAYAAVIP